MRQIWALVATVALSGCGSQLAGVTEGPKAPSATTVDADAGKAPSAPAAPSGCGGLVMTGTQAQMLQSPRADQDAERIALRTTDELVAPEDRYRRISADLTAIRAITSAPGAAGTFRSFGTDRLILAVAPETTAAMVAGSYTSLDCLHAWYGGKRVNVLRALDMVIVSFSTLFHPRRIAEAYAGHPDVLRAEPATMLGGGDDITLCNESFGGTHRYLFHEGSGDCPAGCIDWAYRGYEVTEDGEVTRLAPWKRSSGVEGPTPQWVTRGCFRRPGR